jgi:type IV secretory pathway VirB4 component
MAVAAQTTQSFVPVESVEGGAVVMKDGSLRAIVMTSTVNFALKSADEQMAILAQFQHFLNGLDFSIQIFIQSRRLDIRPYLAVLEERHAEQTSSILKLQTREYIEFIKNFTENSEIMTKAFFIVVPYSGSVITRNKGFGGLFSRGRSAPDTAKEGRVAIEEMQTQLDQRVSVVEQGMSRVGLRTIRLGTEEIVELLYKMLNPGELDKPIKLEK